MAAETFFDRVVKVALWTPSKFGWGLPVVFWGDPGIGKTERIYAAALRYGLDTVRALILSQCNPEDIGGFPLPDGNRVRRMPIGPLADMIDAERGLLFLDELTSSAPALQAPALQVIREHKVGDYSLGKYVRILMAANPPETAAGGWELAPPMINRLVIVGIEAKREEFIQYLMRTSEEEEEIVHMDEKEVEDEFVPRFRGTKAKIAGFLKRHPEHFNVKQKENQASLAFATPRSWDTAARIVAGCEMHLSSKGVSLECRAMLKGTIGEGVSTAFISYLETVAVLPDPEDVLAHPEQAEVYKTQPDLQIALLAAVTAASFSKHPDRKSRMIQALTYMHKVHKAGMGEHAASGVIDILQKDPSLPLERSAKVLFADFLPMLKETRPHWQPRK